MEACSGGNVRRFTPARVASAGQSDEEEAGITGQVGVPGEAVSPAGLSIPGGGAAAGAPFPGGPGIVPGGSSGGNTDKVD